MAEVSYLLADVAADVASYAAGVDTDPARLAAVSERRAALTALTRKYGETVDEVLEWARVAAQRLVGLDGSDERVAELRAEREQLRADPGARRGRAHRGCGRRRGRGSPAAVTAELHSLSMPHARFSVRLERVEDDRTGSTSTAVAGGSPPPASTRSSCCSPPTPAPSRGR